MVKKIGIIGYGEVGQAIAKLYDNPRLSQSYGGQALIKDLSRDDGLENVKILNICIPYKDESFTEIVKKEINKINPQLTIIHSTVAPGTTKTIGGMIVHSPIRGIHPNLYQGIKTFVKYIGADNEEAGNMAQEHLESLELKTKLFQPSTTTELGKLFSTTYYGLIIAWHGEMKRIADQLEVDFDEAVTDFNRTYNEGYKELSKDNVIRPVLHPPEGSIKGHCILPNTEILKKHFQSEVFDLILKYKDK